MDRDVEIGREIAVSDKSLFRAMLTLYKQQTPRERELRATYIHNDVGYDAVDAPFMSECCEQLGQTGMLDFTRKVKARCRMMRYVRQLARLENEKNI